MNKSSGMVGPCVLSCFYRTAAIFVHPQLTIRTALTSEVEMYLDAGGLLNAEAHLSCNLSKLKKFIFIVDP